MSVTTSSGSNVYEYDFCTKDNGKQEVKLYLRSPRQIIEGILAYLGFRNIQYRYYRWFEYREVDDERVFEPANWDFWWQITVHQIGSGQVLIAIGFFQDRSWVRMNLSCESLYGELDFWFGILKMYFIALSQEAAHESVSWWFRLTHNSKHIGPSVLQARTLRSCWLQAQEADFLC